ncbi:nitrilase-related carbon-nitrogen hydrolase [Marinobacter orientalis]|uniref:NAD+ synthetase n=1 Tax=Marinobacter orientalis TaxID=1928859 RepID=A0A7Y0WTB0_9GAMM|nr:nitrilase-related carbon-nitrogen hydrolase [Marinobacter orientalis]NMT64778.1 NAD+ synthetase [Marinobacter orientalis]TGX48769.1 NAD+ synthetase [Marinobacter orientalis]
MITNLNVAVAQINCQLLDVEANLERHREYASQARQNGAEVLLFPELSLTGYQVGRNAPSVAMRSDDPALLDLAKHAKGITLVVGFVERARAGELYNAMAYLRDGRVIHVHRKINLPTYGGLDEGKWFHSGSQIGNVALREHWESSCLICADLWNPALTHCAFLKQPELMLAPINSASGVVSENFSNEDNWKINVSFYAMIYGTPVLMANRYGHEEDLWFWGGSCILGPKGEILAAADDGECIIQAELDQRAIDRARFEMPTVRDSNTRLIRRLLEDHY